MLWIIAFISTNLFTITCSKGVSMDENRPALVVTCGMGPLLIMGHRAELKVLVKGRTNW